MDFTALKTAIQNAVKLNGNEEITGDILQGVLLSMVNNLGDSAINDLISALANEVTNRQNADGTLQTNITNEATARGNADTALGTRIDNEVTARENADTALSNSITAITDAIDNGYVYAGIATTSTEPATGKVFYLTTATGVFTNFGGITDNTKGIKILKKVGSTWTSDTVIVMDDTPTENSTNLVKSGGVYASIASVLSKIAEGYLYVGIATAATNPSTPTTKLFYIATAAGTYTNFLDSSSQPLVLTQGINILKYNGTSWSVEQLWGVDDAPTPSSNNLVKSGGVFNADHINDSILGTHLTMVESSGIYYSDIIPVKAGMKLIYSLFWDNNAAYLIYFSVNADMSNPSALVSPQSSSVMTSGTVDIVSDGYIQAKSLVSGAPSDKFVYLVKDTISGLYTKDETNTKKISSVNNITRFGYSALGAVIGLPLSGGVYTSAITKVSAGDSILYSLYWGTSVWLLKFSVNDDMSGAETIVTAQTNGEMTVGRFNVTTEGYIQARSLESDSPIAPYLCKLYSTNSLNSRLNDLDDVVRESEETDITNQFQENKNWDGSDNDGFASIVNYEIPEGTDFIEAKVYSNFSKTAIVRVYNSQMTMLKTLSVSEDFVWETLRMELQGLDDVKYLRVRTYENNMASATCYLGSYKDNTVLGRLEKLENASNSIFEDINVVWNNNMSLSPEGELAYYDGIKATNWIHGAGVYKINKPNRNSSYVLCYSPDGNTGTKVLSFRNCKNIYILVPNEYPYFRITASSSWDISNIQKIKDNDNHYYNVKDFGAKGDGSTDDTAAIQDAIDCACYGGGGTVYFPVGTFVLNTIQEFDNMKANIIIPYDKNTTLFVNEYDSSKTYYKNSRVLKSDLYYVCKEDGVTGAWDSTKWGRISYQYSRSRLYIRTSGAAQSYRSFRQSLTNGAVTEDYNKLTLIESRSTCDINNGLSEPVSAIACGYDTEASYKLNYNTSIDVENLLLRTDNRYGYSRLCGLNFSHCATVHLTDVCVFSAIYPNQVRNGDIGYLQESGHFSCGVMMPFLYCDPGTSAIRVFISGAYTIGMLIGDCQSIEDCWVGLCKYAYSQCSAGHPSVTGGHIYAFNCNNVICHVSSILHDTVLSNEPDWAANTAYSQNDIVCYNNLYYKCISAHTSGESFDDSKWTLVYLFDEYSPWYSWIFINLISVERALGFNPVAFNTSRMLYDVANMWRGKIGYLNGDNPWDPIPSTGGENIALIDMVNNGQ